MRVIFRCIHSSGHALSSPIGLLGQSAQPPSSVSVPRLVSVTGVYQPADGQPPPAGTVVTLLIYADEHGGTPLWQETQNVVLDKSGRYSLLLGAAQADGIPLEVFASGEAQWLGAALCRARREWKGRARGSPACRTRCESADADTLGGHPASAYQLAPTSTAATDHAATGATSTAKDTAQSNAATDVVLAGTDEYGRQVREQHRRGELGDCRIGGRVGINVNPPADALHVRFTNTIGTMTGLAVQNMGNTAALLFRDAVLRPERPARAVSGLQQPHPRIPHQQHRRAARPTAINFMIGSTSRFSGRKQRQRRHRYNICRSRPRSQQLADRRACRINRRVDLRRRRFRRTFVARKARGTQAAPTAVQNGDQIALFSGVGQTTTHSGNLGNGMSVNAAENYTDAAQGTALNFFTTKRGTNAPVTAMTLDDAGNLGIGTSGPSAAAGSGPNGDSGRV